MSRKREPPCKRAANHNFCYRDRLCPGVPLLPGEGSRMFELDDVGESKPLELVSCHPRTNGVVVLSYRRRR